MNYRKEEQPLPPGAASHGYQHYQGPHGTSAGHQLSGYPSNFENNLHKAPTQTAVSLVSLRHTNQNTHRSNSISNINRQGNLYDQEKQTHMHQERSFEPLQPIMSSHGGEITSRTSRKSSPRPMDYNLTANNYPMRQSPIRAQTPGVNQPHMSQLQSRQNANDYYSLAGDSK